MHKLFNDMQAQPPVRTILTPPLAKPAAKPAAQSPPLKQPVPATPKKEYPEPDSMMFTKSRQEKIPLRITLLDGTVFEGPVRIFGQYNLILETAEGQVLIFKNACSHARYVNEPQF